MGKSLHMVSYTLRGTYVILPPTLDHCRWTLVNKCNCYLYFSCWYVRWCYLLHYLIAHKPTMLSSDKINEMAIFGNHFHGWSSCPGATLVSFYKSWLVLASSLPCVSLMLSKNKHPLWLKYTKYNVSVSSPLLCCFDVVTILLTLQFCFFADIAILLFCRCCNFIVLTLQFCRCCRFMRPSSFLDRISIFNKS